MESKNRLREFRFFKGLTQWQLRVSTGINQTKLSLIERGYIEPKAEEKKALSKVLGAKPEELFPSD